MRYISWYFFTMFFLFSVSVDSCNGSPRSSSLVLPLLSGPGFSVNLLTSNFFSFAYPTLSGSEGTVVTGFRSLGRCPGFSCGNPVMKMMEKLVKV